MKTYHYLNLQQKLCKVRKRIPALVKKRYSEDVDYDFAKIDDIYQFLTPALNKYGVNFTVCEEEATHRDEQGNLVYLYLDNGFWIYEADLRLRWINTDNPSEQEEAVIHVVGTHDMAEKAKGTAWTYGLKYYMFGRFNINQGGDDADYHDFKAEPEKKEQTEASGREKKGQRYGKETAETAAGDGRAAEKEKTAKKQETVKAAGRTAESMVADSVRAQVENQAAASGKPPVEKKEEKRQAERTKDVSEQAAEAKPEEKTEGQISFTDAMQKEKEAVNDGFQAASEEEIPFEDAAEEKDDAFFQSLMDEMGDGEDTTEKMTVEAARKVICIAGAYVDRPLGDVLDAKERGRKTLEWLVNKYNGPDQEQKQAAAVLLEELNRLLPEAQAA